MILFRRTSRGLISPWIERASYRGKLVSHVTFDSAGPETWSVVSCGLVATVYDRVSRVFAYPTGPRAKLE